jgi:hypothetical protein
VLWTIVILRGHRPPPTRCRGCSMRLTS